MNYCVNVYKKFNIIYGTMFILFKKIKIIALPIDGIEPPTFALQERRSTTKPNSHFG